MELPQTGSASHKLKRSRLIGEKVERFGGSGNVSNMSKTDDSPQNVLSFCAGATTSAALWSVCLTAFIYISRVPSCSLSLKDRGIPTFLGHHDNAAARKGRENARGGGEKERWGRGCVNNANATSLITNCVFTPPPLLLSPSPLPRPHCCLPLLFRGLKTLSLNSAAIVICIIVGSFSRRRYPR